MPSRYTTNCWHKHLVIKTLQFCMPSSDNFLMLIVLIIIHLQMKHHLILFSILSHSCDSAKRFPGGSPKLYFHVDSIDHLSAEMRTVSQFSVKACFSPKTLLTTPICLQLSYALYDASRTHDALPLPKQLTYGFLQGSWICSSTNWHGQFIRSQNKTSRLLFFKRKKVGSRLESMHAKLFNCE